MPMYVEQVLKSRQPDLYAPGLATAVELCLDCAQACRAGADVCIADFPELGRAIRLQLDCAAIASATADLLSRPTDPDWQVLVALLRACSIACNNCAAECDRYANVSEACRIVASACRDCEHAVLRMMPGLTAEA